MPPSCCATRSQWQVRAGAQAQQRSLRQATGKRGQPILREHINRGHRYITGAGLGPLLVRAVAGSGAVQLLAMLGTFIVGIQLARGLGPAAYGRYGIALAILTLMMVPGGLGIPKFVTREVAAALALKDWPRLFGVIKWADRTCVIASVLVSVITAGIAVAVASQSRNLSIAIVVGIPSILLLTLANVRAGALQGMHQVVRGQIPTFLLRPFVFSLTLFLLFSLQERSHSWDAMAAYSLTAVISFIAGEIWMRRYLPAARPSTLADDRRQWLRSSIPMGLTDGLQVLQGQLSILILGALAAATQVGLFRIALSIYVATSVPATFIAIAVGPTIARLHSQGDERLQKVLARSAQVQFATVLLVCLPLLAFPAVMLSFVFGHVYGASADALIVLLIGQLINAAFGLNSQLLNMTGHEKRLTEATVAGLVTNIVVTAALVPRLGGVGAAIGTSASMLVWNGIASYQAWRRLGMGTSIFASASPRLAPAATTDREELLRPLPPESPPPQS